MPQLRINARLDEITAEDLTFLRHELGEISVTEVIKYSIKQAVKELKTKAKATHTKNQIFRNTLIGEKSRIGLSVKR